MSDEPKDDASGKLFFQSSIFHGACLPRRPRLSGVTIHEPARVVPVFRDCDVLVVGGGPATASFGRRFNRSDAMPWMICWPDQSVMRSIQITSPPVDSPPR